MDIDNLQPVISDKIQTIVKSNKVSMLISYMVQKVQEKKPCFTVCSLLTGFDHDEFINNPNIFFVIPGNRIFISIFLKVVKLIRKNIKNGTIIGEKNYYFH
ncbi:MAG: hypothetical protein CM1200mP31_0940 [Candidatus Neomarinimicrobiota bacterium]|nr:MAG: hypothetical protein CM1200mP31_0940 [Candidatus Neomarinimicrobiota bacterium]